MTGKLSKNFHGVGIGPLSKILAVQCLSTIKKCEEANKILRIWRQRWARSKRRLKNYKRFGPQFIFFYLSGRGDRPFLACLSKEKKDKKSMLQEAMSCLECNLLCDTKRVLDQHVYMMHSLDKSKIGLSQFTTKCFHCKKVSALLNNKFWLTVLFNPKISIRIPILKKILLL